MLGVSILHYSTGSQNLRGFRQWLQLMCHANYYHMPEYFYCSIVYSTSSHPDITVTSELQTLTIEILRHVIVGWHGT